MKDQISARKILTVAYGAVIATAGIVYLGGVLLDKYNHNVGTKSVRQAR
jgi:hypothetical protein